MKKIYKGDEPVNPDNQLYLICGYRMKGVEGEILTLVDASVADPTQRKAMKDIVRKTLWVWIQEANMLDGKHGYEVHEETPN